MTTELLIIIWAFQSVFAYDGTTTFDSILVAHPSPTFCPPVKEYQYPARSWKPDANYIACCNQFGDTYTLTSGKGPGGTSVYACCLSGYTCTEPVSLMMDWSIDANNDLYTTDLANPPLPATVPASPTPTSPRQTNTGTVSRPGATPIATSSGVVVYVYNDNSNSNTNTNTNDNTNDNGKVDDGGGGLSGGAIAGITVAATVVSAIAAVFGVKYSRRQARNAAGPTSGGKA